MKAVMSWTAGGFDIKKILVIKPSSLGDIIHALPFLKAVKDAFPRSQIDWVISKAFKGIIEGNPLIHEIIPFDKDAWRRVSNLRRTISEISLLKKNLKAKHYDIVVDLQGLLRSGIIASFANASLKIGFADAREGSRHFYDKAIPVNGVMHAVDKCLEAAKAVGASVGKAEFPLYVDEGARAGVRKLLGDVREYVVIVPSARWETKRWNAEKFTRLIRQIPLSCVIAGSRADKKIAGVIIKSRPQSTAHSPQSENKMVLDLCGKTDLKELVALIAGARAVVSNDSGPAHIAAALKTPVVAIFGPTEPEKTGPYGWQENRGIKVVRAKVACSPCRKKKCWESICMKNVPVEQVLNALKEYL